MRPIFSRCTQTPSSFAHEGSLCIHVFCIYICACCRPRSVSPVRPEQPMCLAAGEPSDLGRVKDSAWANERVEGGGGRGRSRWCHWMPGNLSLCVSVSVYIWPALTLTSSKVRLAHRTGPQSRKGNFYSFTSHTAPFSRPAASHSTRSSRHIRALRFHTH